MSSRVLSGSRPGIGSVVNTDDALARTVAVVGVGVVPTAAVTPPASGGPIVTMIH